MVFRRAELLPELPWPEEDVKFGELLDVVHNLSVEEREEVLRYGWHRYNFQNERANPAPQTRSAKASSER